MNSKSKLQTLFVQEKPWTNNQNTIWLSSQISFRRNVEKFKFPAKLDRENREKLLQFIASELLKSPYLVKPIFFKGDELNVLEKEFLVEHFLSSQSYSQSQAGEGFVLDESGEFLATINLYNHLQLYLIDCKGELEKAWNRLVEIERALGGAVRYAYSKQYGFLTADPTECGTAMMATIYLQPSALIHQEVIDEFLDEAVDESLQITGLQGNPTEIIGDVLVVQNNYTLGVNEETIISSLRNFVTKLLLEESRERRKAKKEESASLKDKVARAFGILLHSYQIEAIEALNAISLLKLGVDLGWVQGITIEEVNLLLFHSRRAHLELQYGGEPLKQEELLHRRAEFIHQVLKAVKLEI